MHVVVVGSRDRAHPLLSADLLPQRLHAEAAPLAAGGAFVPIADAHELRAALDHVLRGNHLVLGVLLDRAPNQRRFAATHCLERARADRHGINIDAPPHDPRGPALTALLRLTATIMRARTPAMWQALDALARTNNNANRAAALLGCSGQAVRTHRARAQHAATADLETLMAFVVAPPTISTEPPRRAA